MKRIETVIPAALFTCDYDEWPRLVPLDGGQHVTPCDLLGVKPDRPDVLALIEARPVADPADSWAARFVEWHDEKLENAQKLPLRVLRVRVIAEVEELPEDEARRWIAEAKARDEERARRDDNDARERARGTADQTGPHPAVK